MSLERNGNSPERGLRLTISHGLGEDLDTCQAGDGLIWLNDFKKTYVKFTYAAQKGCSSLRRGR